MKASDLLLIWNFWFVKYVGHWCVKVWVYVYKNVVMNVTFIN